MTDTGLQWNLKSPVVLSRLIQHYNTAVPFQTKLGNQGGGGTYPQSKAVGLDGS